MTIDPPVRGVTADALSAIALTLGERGLVIRDDFLPRELIAQLAEEARGLQNAGELRAAGIGRGRQFQANRAIRTDHIQWLDPDTATPAQRHYLDILEELRQAINRTLFLGLFEFEGHLAVYPPGAFYRKHLDQFQGSGQRLVTVILYLNPDWREADGGQLRLYLDPEPEPDPDPDPDPDPKPKPKPKPKPGPEHKHEPQPEREPSHEPGPEPKTEPDPEPRPALDSDPADAGHHQDLLPLAGRLVCFLSGDFPHEVLPARRERLSITGWFKKRD